MVLWAEGADAAAAAVRALLAAEIHHTHQCLPNEDSLSIVDNGQSPHRDRTPHVVHNLL